MASYFGGIYYHETETESHWRPAADIKLSKFLSYICRHGALREEIDFLSGGFVPVWAILSHPGGRGYSEEDVRRVVATCPLSRFTLGEDLGQLLIRANRGHSINVQNEDMIRFTPVLREEDAPTVIYGTSKKAWKKIRANGLSIRNKYIHFATRLCMPGDQDTGLKSDTKTNSEVYIFIDVKRALNDGIRFQRSTDGIVRCPGNEYGVIPAEYFCEVRVAEKRLPLRPYINILLYFTWYPGISERHHNYCKSMHVCVHQPCINV